MIQGIKQKIISIYISRRKFFNIVGISLLVVLLITFNVLQNKGKKEEIKSTFPPKPTPSNGERKTNPPAPSGIPFTLNPNESYFINQIITNKIPVTGYSWKGNKLMYSTPTGIYEAGTNNPTLEQNIESISWANSFNAILKSGGSWKKYDFFNKKTEELPYTLNNPRINTKGEMILDHQKNIVKLFDLKNNTDRGVSFEEPVDKMFFIGDTNSFVVSTTYGNKTHIYKYNEGLTREQSVGYEKKYHLSSISPSGDSFALTFGNELIIANFSGSISNNIFPNKSDLFTGYKNNSEIVIIERYKDSLNRTLENIYLSNLSGQKFKISDSRPIKNRININIPIAFNKIGGVTAFAENNGKIWILALTPNVFPTYSTGGELVFSKMESKGF